MGRAEPMRTCIATRRTRPAGELMRVALDPKDPGRVLADPNRALPGRGAWLTPSLEALRQAEKRRAFPRALRVSGPLDTSHVESAIAARDREHAPERRIRTTED
ncbi:YlxR family protein [Corynebacterium otitidis]|uniref:YlxR domain-containing protein n=2 Tax=Corynebacterium otitidis ATCC 51513 TaxID=883169 RepID=I7KIU2_9CORY|nr:hypothetical protein BN46_0387 [Corynebacterium otitidis ATCC 51513]